MRAAMTQARHIALLAKPLTEITGREWPTELSIQESQMMGWCLGDNSSKRWVNRNREFDARFLLTEMQHAVPNMLRSHPHDVRSPLAGVEQKGERQACETPYRVTFLEFRDLVVVPAMVTVRFDADCPHVARRIVGA